MVSRYASNFSLKPPMPIFCRFLIALGRELKILGPWTWKLDSLRDWIFHLTLTGGIWTSLPLGWLKTLILMIVRATPPLSYVSRKLFDIKVRFGLTQKAEPCVCNNNPTIKSLAQKLFHIQVSCAFLVVLKPKVYSITTHPHLLAWWRAKSEVL